MASGRNRGGSSFLGAKAMEPLDGAQAADEGGLEGLGSLFPGFGETPEDVTPADPAAPSPQQAAPEEPLSPDPAAENPPRRAGASSGKKRKVSRVSPFSDDESVVIEDDGPGGSRYHYSAFSSPNPFVSDDGTDAETDAGTPEQPEAGGDAGQGAGLPPDGAADGETVPQQEQPSTHGEDAGLKSNVFGYEEGWYEKVLAEERRKKEEAEARERNEVPCITLAELEEIRKGAYDDGFAEGQKAGFDKGHEEGLAAGHEEGLKSGHDEGYQAGVADGAAAVEEEKAKFAALAERLGKPLELVSESIEKDLLQVVARIARAFLEREARVPSFLAKSLHTAVAALPSTKEGVTVMLSPADAAELLKLMPDESLKDLGWKVVSDASVADGDIRNDSGSSSVDWKLSERIDAVIERFVNENSGGND